MFYCPMHMARLLDAFEDADRAYIKAQADRCPECLESRARSAARRIDDSQPAGEMIELTCINHSDLRWMTKNIDFIGARSIFYTGKVDNVGYFPDVPECDCSIKYLAVVVSSEVKA